LGDLLAEIHPSCSQVCGVHDVAITGDGLVGAFEFKVEGSNLGAHGVDSTGEDGFGLPEVIEVLVPVPWTAGGTVGRDFVGNTGDVEGKRGVLHEATTSTVLDGHGRKLAGGNTGFGHGYLTLGSYRIRPRSGQ